MGYAEVQKLHEIKSLGPELGPPSREDVLRVILAIAIDHEAAAWCIGQPSDAPIARWPSTLYRVLARAALQSAEVWWRTSIVLDRALHDAVLPYRNRSAAEVAEAFSEGRDSLDGEELAGLLWCLLRRNSRTEDLVAERLSLELQVVAARRLRFPATSRT
jgi:hypothetical protein